MAKVLMDGWGTKRLVIDAEVAEKIQELLVGFELYEEVNHGSYPQMDYTYHIYEPNPREMMTDGVSFRLLPKSGYQIAKLAGRPKKK